MRALSRRRHVVDLLACVCAWPAPYTPKSGPEGEVSLIPEPSHVTDGAPPGRRLAVFTSSRGDLGSLGPLIEALAAHPGVEVTVIASGTHTAPVFGTWNLAIPDEDLELVACGLADDDSPTALVAVAAQIAIGVSAVLARRPQDILVVAGDRYELLGAVTAAVLHRVPVAHLSGGEITEGAIDDSIRHAVTKLAHLHFCNAEEYAARVRSLGEEPWRIHVTGDPAIDRLAGLARQWNVADLEAIAGLEIRHPFGLLTYHPPTLAPWRAGPELDSLLDGAGQLATVIATYPCADPGSAEVLDRLRSWAKQRDGVALVESLGDLYPAALAHADVVLGNSSSGLVETPAFGVPTVNVGDRQRGRARPANVIDVPGDRVAVADAISRALDPAFRANLSTVTNPYGDGWAGQRVADVLLSTPLDRLLVKRFCDPTPT
jgi:UDP-hydrolysing UDP-N-acetyl-D-glucosamine 2-epimerase